jgi:hypothetical protein
MPVGEEESLLTDLNYELRDDGVLYVPEVGTRIRVRGKSANQVRVRSKGMMSLSLPSLSSRDEGLPCASSRLGA